MGEWGIDRWLALGGLSVAVCGVGLAYYFYRKTIRSKLLAIGYTVPVPAHVIDPAVELASMLPTNQTRSFVLLWNRGSAPIVEADFTRPITIERADQVREISIFDKDAASSIRIVGTKEIEVKLLRPGEAVILEIRAEASETLGLSVEMLSSDMSEFFQRRRVVPQPLEIFGFLFLVIGLPFLAAGVSALIVPIPSIWGLVPFFVGLFLAISMMHFATKMPERLQKSITPSVVWKFFGIKDAASQAAAAAQTLRWSFAMLGDKAEDGNQKPQ